MSRFLLFVVITAIIGCTDGNNKNTIKEQVDELDMAWLELLPPRDSLREGDLITRLGKDFISEAMRGFSHENKDYSHIGLLALDEDSNWIVYHAIGSETNPEGLLRKDRLELFCNPIENIQFGVYRFSDTTINFKKVLSFAEQKQKEKIVFDFDFDLDTDDELYCSEFIYKAFRYANPELDLIKIDLNDGKKYLPLDNVYHNINCRLVYKMSFNKN